jgi:hypothetical protein
MRRGWTLGLAATCLALLLPTAARAAGVQPNPHDYGNQTVGTSSQATSFTLGTSTSVCTMRDMMGICTQVATNSVDTSALGGGPGSNTTAGDFPTHNINCPYPTLMSLPIEGSFAVCQFEVSFAPIAAGPRSRTLTFPQNGGAGASLGLTGIGIAAPSGSPVPNVTHKKCKKRKHRASSAKKCKKKR